MSCPSEGLPDPGTPAAAGVSPAPRCTYHSCAWLRACGQASRCLLVPTSPLGRGPHASQSRRGEGVGGQGSPAACVTALPSPSATPARATLPTGNISGPRSRVGARGRGHTGGSPWEHRVPPPPQALQLGRRTGPQPRLRSHLYFTPRKPTPTLTHFSNVHTFSLKKKNRYL